MHSGPGYGLHTIAWPPLAALIKYAHLPGFYQIPTGWPPYNPTAPSTNKQLLSSPTQRAYQYDWGDSENRTLPKDTIFSHIAQGNAQDNYL